MDIVIRDIRPEDGAALAALHRRAIRAIPETVYAAPQRESWLHGIDAAACLRISRAGERVLIAASPDGAIIGFCSFVPASDLLAGLFVDPSAQGKGVGRALADRAEAEMADAGRITVEASLSGVTFYARRGYRTLEQTRHTTPGGGQITIHRMVKTLAPSGAPWRNFHGRRHGKKLRPGQRRLLDTRLAALSPGAVGWDENPERAPLDLAALFPGKTGVWLEIGFGGGEHMIHQAVQHPEVGIIGCEPFVNGVAMLLAAIERSEVSNLRIHSGDARDLMDVLPAASISRVFLLYPDPWPKTRHHKRRFVNPDNLDQLARVMAPGAELRVATDIADYVRHCLEAVGRDSRFDHSATGPGDRHRPWPGWPGTRYEEKARRAGRDPHYLTFARL